MYCYTFLKALSLFLLCSAHSNNIQAALIMIHMPTFAGEADPSKKPEEYCGVHGLRAWAHPKGEGSPLPVPNSSTNSTRMLARRDMSSHEHSHTATASSRLVVSEKKGQSASELCHSTTSRGPDFVSLDEGVFCDMDSRKVYPSCNDHVTGDCFDLSHRTLVLQGKLLPRRMQKDYSEIIAWK
jgi:hypothetical protein